MPMSMPQRHRLCGSSFGVAASSPLANSFASIPSLPLGPRSRLAGGAVDPACRRPDHGGRGRTAPSSAPVWAERPCAPPSGRSRRAREGQSHLEGNRFDADLDGVAASARPGEAASRTAAGRRGVPATSPVAAGRCRSCAGVIEPWRRGPYHMAGCGGDTGPSSIAGRYRSGCTPTGRWARVCLCLSRRRPGTWFGCLGCGCPRQRCRWC